MTLLADTVRDVATRANIAEYLRDMAQRQPDAPAIVAPRGRLRQRAEVDRWSFAQLDRASDAVARELAAQGVSAGMRVALFAPPSLPFFAVVFGIFKRGAVLVGIDPGLGLRNIRRCLAVAEPGAFVGNRMAHWARRLLGWGRGSCRVHLWIDEVDAWVERQRREDGEQLPTTQPCDMAAILFTSGSTGPPKGVVYTHGNFVAQLTRLQETFAIEPGEVDCCTFPLFALFAPALGMTAVIPRMNFVRPAAVDPAEIARPVSEFAATNLFGSPALLNRISSGPATCETTAADAAAYRSLRRVVSAGAPVSPRIIERMTKLLPTGVQVFTPYGATEALPVACIGSDEILRETAAATFAGRGICVGRPVAKTEVRIVRITDGPLPTWSSELLASPGEIGEIVVRGEQVTAEYFRQPEATALAKIADPAGGFWHRMGDVGYFDEPGRLWFCGRKSQRVRTAGGDLFTIPCEGVFNAHAAVYRTALVGVGGAGEQRPVLCVELLPEQPWRGSEAALREELLVLGARQAITREIRDILFHPGFPVDIRHNAKIGREQLAAWAARQLAKRRPARDRR